MAAPTFAAIGGILTGSGSTTAAFPVPAGVVGTTTDPTEIIGVAGYVENSQAWTPSSGFVHAGSSPVTNPSATKPIVLSVFWKRATTAESGTYPFTVASGLSWREGYAFRLTGCHPTDPNPFDFTTSQQADSGAAGAFTSVSGTTLGPDRLLLYIATTYDGRATTTAAGFTDESSSGAWLLSDKAQAAAGGTGSIAGSWSGSNTSTVIWLGAVKPPGAAVNTNQFFATL